MVSAESALKADGEQTLLTATALSDAADETRTIAGGDPYSTDKGASPVAVPGAGAVDDGTAPAATRHGAPGYPALQRLERIANRQVTAADGQQYLLHYDVENLCRLYHNGHRSNILNMRSPLFWLGLTGGLLFSFLLAWNLTRPMCQLRSAFERVSLGDLSVRLHPIMRSCHDEITEVSKDFDAMAERLQVLVAAREALLMTFPMNCARRWPDCSWP